VESSVAIGVPLIEQNPGIFSNFGQEPRRAVAFHGSSRASALVFIDGPAKTGDIIKLTIQDDRVYEYTVVDDDVVNLDDDNDNRSIAEINATNRIIRQKFIDLINEDPEVEAFPTPFFTRVLLLARQEGPEVNGTIQLAVAEPNGNVTLTLSKVTMGGANVAGALVTDENPLEAGELFVVYATGLGTITGDDNGLLKTGERYLGTAFHETTEQLDSLAAGRTATTVAAIAKPGTFGLYEITLEANSSVGTDPLSQLTVFQSWYVSNIAAVPTQALPDDEEEEEDDED
ncbi:MAG: hypothetical protein KIT83_17410, partial [Bryobacterales bacterium]|nr:hypothetical protein [Bryobacterales bacterium]